MGSPLGPVLAGIFMVHFERSLVPLLTAKLMEFFLFLLFQKLSIVFGIAKVDYIGIVDYILSMLNDFHPIIQFTYETEYNFKSGFLDVMPCRDGKNIVTAVYRKLINGDVYLNCCSFVPHSWERGTLKTLT